MKGGSFGETLTLQVDTETQANRCRIHGQIDFIRSPHMQCRSQELQWELFLEISGKSPKKDREGHPGLRDVGLSFGLALALLPLALIGVQPTLAQPDAFRRHLDQLLVRNVRHCLFEGQLDRRGQQHGIVLA